jgi:hypothetical protein
VIAINGNYVLRETTANLTRNPTLSVASILTVFVSLAIVGTAVLVRQGAQNMTRRFEEASSSSSSSNLRSPKRSWLRSGPIWNATPT